MFLKQNLRLKYRYTIGEEMLRSYKRMGLGWVLVGLKISVWTNSMEQ